MQKSQTMVAVTTACLLGLSAGSARGTLVAHYEFNETSGTTVSDSAGSNDGTATDLTFAASGAGVGGADLGNAGVFNGYSSEVSLGEPEALDLGTGDFTIAGWFKMPTNQEEGVYGNRPVFQNISYAGGGFVFEVGRNDRSYAGEIFFTVGGGPSSDFNQTQVFSDGRVDDDQWHWVAVTNTGGNTNMYIDGLLQVDTGALVDGISTATSPEGIIAQFGARGFAQQPYEGSLDDWRVYDESLSVTLDGSNYLIGGDLYDVWQTGASVQLDGDLNDDGFVGLDDLDIILNNWNANVTAGSWPDGDPSNDGFVGLDDLDIVLNNWNAGTPAAASVPEPAALAIMGLGGLAVIRRH